MFKSFQVYSTFKNGNFYYNKCMCPCNQSYKDLYWQLHSITQTSNTNISFGKRKILHIYSFSINDWKIFKRICLDFHIYIYIYIEDSDDYHTTSFFFSMIRFIFISVFIFKIKDKICYFLLWYFRKQLLTIYGKFKNK